ncbi:methyltransferase domain-containing protein [Thermodesulfobacteriota bacterium]
MKNSFSKYSHLNIVCPICGHGDNIYYQIQKNAFYIYRCDSCYLLFVHPQPSNDELFRIYDHNYFMRGNKYLRNDETESNKQNLNNDKQKLNIIKKYMKNGHILDVGCAMGDFLNYARQEGFEVTGVEISAITHLH